MIVLLRSRLILLILSSVYILISAKAFAGWYIVEKSEDKFGNVSYQSTFIQDGMMRIENAQTIFILNQNTNKITLIFPQKMTYWIGDHDSLQTAVLDNIRIQMIQEIAQLRSDERQAAEDEYNKMILAAQNDSAIHHLPDQIKIRKSDSTLKVCGLLSICYHVFIDTVINENVWISKQVSPYNTLDIRKITKMTKVFSKPSFVTFYRTSEEWFDLIQNGVIVKSALPTEFGESVTYVESIKETNVPVAFFEPPSNYRKINVDELIQITMGEEKVEPIENPSSPTQPDYQNMFSLPDKK